MYRQLKQTAFEMLSGTQAYTRIGGIITDTLAHRACSSGDVDACYVVGIVLEATLPTTKEPLSAAIGSLAMAASRARLGGVARIDHHDCNSLEGALVLQKEPEHRVRPQIVLVTGGFTSPCGLLSEVRQVLYGERVAGSKRVNYLAANDVQGVADEAPLFTGEPIPEALESSGAFGVELASDLATFGPVVKPLGLQRTAGEHFAGSQSGDYGLAHVEANRLASRRAFPTRRFRDIGADSDVHIPLAMLSLDQLPALNTRSVGKEMPLVIANSQRNALSAANRGQADRFVLHPKRQSALIVGHGAVLEAAGLLALARRHAADGLHRKVRREAEPLSKVVVAEPVQRKPSPLTMLAGYLERAVAGIRKGRNRSLQRPYLTRRGLKLGLYSESHGFGHCNSHHGREAVKRVFLRPLKGAVSNPSC